MIMNSKEKEHNMTDFGGLLHSQKLESLCLLKDSALLKEFSVLCACVWCLLISDYGKQNTHVYKSHAVLQRPILSFYNGVLLFSVNVFWILSDILEDFSPRSFVDTLR